MSVRTPYSISLDAIGLSLDRAGAADVLVNELDGGFLLSYMSSREQHVVTLDAAELQRLRQEALRSKSRPSDTGRRARLRAVGRYLDERQAYAAVVQERATGYSLEFTGLPKGDDLSSLARLYESLDEEQIAALAKYPHT